MNPEDEIAQSPFLRCPISRINFAPAQHSTREQRLPHCHMVTLDHLVPPHCHARPGQCASCMGFSLKKVNFGHTGSELAKSAANNRHLLALYPSIFPSPYYNIVKELSHLNHFRASYRSRSAKSKIQKRSRPRRVKRMLAGQVACSLVSGQSDDEKFNSDII